MRKVVTISLNGNAYQIEEDGYQALHAYLEAAQAKLLNDPDRAEILADLEQAIGEKCNHFLSSHKSVVSAEEMQRTLAEMGPVDGPAAAPGAAAGAGTAGGAAAPDAPTAGADTSGAHSGSTAPKRLYQIREGAMISGICKGIAAYFDVDVAIVRVIFVALAILTWGGWILAYIVMMFVIPYASTSEEHAAAHGLPFNAQHLVDQAKQHYASFKQGAPWGRQWQRQYRKQSREWRRESRQRRQTMRDHMRWGPPPDIEDTGYATRVLMGVMIPIATICNAVLMVAFVVAVAQLFMRGTIFGWPPPAGIPPWGSILILFVLFHICAAPLRAARHAALYSYGHSANVWFALWGGILWLVLVVLFFVFAFRYWPDLQHFLQQLLDSIGNHRARATGDNIFWSMWAVLGGSV